MIKNCGIKPCRPILNEHEHIPEVVQLANQCWEELPSDRPTFQNVRKFLKKIRMTRYAAKFVHIQPLCKFKDEIIFTFSRW
ncbi:hypothetical protein DPMN_131506 [Dreissena polymorpha]|uniref:Serine-threonine/tyrosine-protein kinase catalytic domain-containing protein n=1 Tax=Dreissena polymorpha TaxID=45954 RepID=A0A9D4H6Q8_DREPO|nr:hypothetical protein DPMN_131506 [Dreissena polymorpha]